MGLACQSICFVLFYPNMILYNSLICDCILYLFVVNNEKQNGSDKSSILRL